MLSQSNADVPCLAHEVPDAPKRVCASLITWRSKEERNGAECAYFGKESELVPYRVIVLLIDATKEEWQIKD